MSDTFGLLPIPLVAPTVTTAPPGSSTTLVAVALSYFTAVLNANAPTAWRAIYKDQANAPVVKGAVDDDPNEATINDTLLPGLFLWRESAEEPYDLAADYFVQQTTLRLIWLQPTAIAVKRSARSPIINGIAKTLTWAVENNRDPSWVVAGDPDPQAATKGSRFSTYAGWMEFHVGPWKPYEFGLKGFDKGPAPRTYYGLSLACRILEKLNLDITLYDANGGNALTITTPDGGVGDGGVVTERINLP